MQQNTFGVDLMDIACGGFLDNQTTNWLQQRSEALMSTVSATTASWLNKARDFYTTISESDAVQALRNLTIKADNSWKTNVIFQCKTINELQTANPIQQRYIMAEPRLRELYLNQSVEGYGDSYENVHGDAVGLSHYDYRRVTDGIMFFHNTHVEYNQFIENIPHGDKPLELHEKVDLIRTWNLVNIALDANETDPTSPIGNLL